MKRALITSMLFVSARALAQEAPPPEQPKPVEATPAEEPKPAEPQKKPTDEATAVEVADAPLPGQESGRSDDGDKDSTLRNVGQGVLFVPRMALEVAFLPVRGSLWAYDHYSLGGRLHRMAFDKTNTYGAYPTLVIDTDYGVTLGGRFVHRDVFGARERFSARAGFGGEFNQVVSGLFKTGDRLGDTASMELFGEFERRPKDPFYGIGNNGDAMETRHRQSLQRVTTTLDLEMAPSFHVRANGALTDLDYDVADEGPNITEVYGPEMLTGFTGTRNLYGELELRYDSRRVSNTLESKGVLVDAFAGRIHQLEAGNDYWRYGGEVVHFQPLGLGRTLATRLHLESVTGALNDVAFTQLPQLGGKALLRGYAADRFRDRAAALGSAEYMWDLSSFLLASVFVDVGRVYPDIRDVSFDDLRLGYGGSLQLVEKRSFLAGVSVASSIDGGLFFNLVLDPVYEPEPRVKQK
jgi:hypothetical protein